MLVQTMPRINPEYREDAKKKIIDAALEVAREDGWGGLTLEAVARKVGVTKGAFYSYFANSGTLMQDVMVTMIRRIRDNVLGILTGEENGRVAIERLGDLIFLEPKPFIPIFIQAIAGMPRDPAFLARISALFDENSEEIVSRLARFQKKGQIPADVDLKDASRAIYCLTIGLAFTAHVLGKDGRLTRQTWLNSVERILKLDEKGRKDGQ